MKTGDTVRPASRVPFPKRPCIKRVEAAPHHELCAGGVPPQQEERGA